MVSFDSSMIEKLILKRLEAMPKVLIIRCDRCDYLSPTDLQFIQDHNLQSAFCNKYHEELAAKAYKQLLNRFFQK